MFAVFCQLIPLNPTHRTFKCLNLLGFLHWIFLHRKKKKSFFFLQAWKTSVRLWKTYFLWWRTFSLASLCHFSALQEMSQKNLIQAPEHLFSFISPFLLTSPSLSLYLWLIPPVWLLSFSPSSFRDSAVTSDDLLAWLHPFCGDASLPVRPRIDVLQILESNFSLQDSDVRLLLLYRTQAVLKDREVTHISRHPWLISHSLTVRMEEIFKCTLLETTSVQSTLKTEHRY